MNWTQQILDAALVRRIFARGAELRRRRRLIAHLVRLRNVARMVCVALLLALASPAVADPPPCECPARVEPLDVQIDRLETELRLAKATRAVRAAMHKRKTESR